MSSYDVICINELHTKNYTSIPGFCPMKQIFLAKNNKSPKIGGDIAVYVSQVQDIEAVIEFPELKIAVLHVA